jgi:hypothetical protein
MLHAVFINFGDYCDLILLFEGANRIRRVANHPSQVDMARPIPDLKEINKIY